MATKPTIFIDGEAGTTGLQIRARLARRDDVEVVSIDPAKRKDAAERKKLLNAVDLAILCLPDAAAREAVSLVENPSVKVLDASSAHRTTQGWTYGFPELTAGQRQAVAEATRVSNPGCYPTGFLALVRPLVEDGVIAPGTSLTVNAVSGYSGGGRALVEAYESAEPVGGEAAYPFGLYGLGFDHKHLPEMRVQSGLDSLPLFSPAVGHYKCGMLVQVPLSFDRLSKSAGGLDLHRILARHYEGERFVRVMPYQGADSLRDGKFLDARGANGTNDLELFVFANDSQGQALLVARLDNLGKGASGAAVQNLNLMLGFAEEAGLEDRLPEDMTVMAPRRG